MQVKPAKFFNDSELIGAGAGSNIGFKIAIGYAVCIAGTFILAGLGLLWRKVFGIDEKLKAIYGEDLEEACCFDDD